MTYSSPTTLEKNGLTPVPGSNDMEQDTPEAIEDARSLGNEHGVPWVWVAGGAMATILFLMISLFGIILSQGVTALWPKQIAQIEESGNTFLGVPFRWVEGSPTESGATGEKKLLLHVANHDMGGAEFTFVSRSAFDAAAYPKDVWYVERLEWGPFIGRIVHLGSLETLGEQDVSALPPVDTQALQQAIRSASARLDDVRQIEKYTIGELNHQIENLRVERRGIVRRMQTGAEADGPAKLALIDAQIQDLYDKSEAESQVVQRMRAEDAQQTLVLTDVAGNTKELPVSQIVRAFTPNDLSIVGKVSLFFSRVWEFISQEPREANTAGGVFPALFGTVAMTMIMSIAILPFGVLTAVYIREIAKQGPLVSFVRVAVGNLAGVPSIVYGVFGLGFFCYTLGVSIDQLFFVDRLPNPTFGTGGILWASLTLALLTVPVVIVSTEEALAAVPRTLREASYGCGATRLQTLVRIILPKAMPGIMTGLILAMARGAGEVAPLLVTGVVKLAPALPIDQYFPFVHLERSFMHLGFHIYDLGFQSRSTEASRPMVFASTLLLIGLVLVLNFAAIKLRSFLRRRFEGRGAF